MPQEFPPHFRILIVTSDENFQREARIAFDQKGLDSLELRDPSRTAEVAAQDQPDLVLLDADVAGFDGRDLLSALKRDPRTKRIPVFLMSGVDRPWGRSFALALGADEYLDKPVFVGAVARRIRAHIQSRAAAISPPARQDSIGSAASEIDRLQADVLRAEERERARSPKLRGSCSTDRPVLIVEDDADVREALANILEDEGIPTLAARNGQEALDLLHAEGVNPALILLDLMMPIMNGWEFRRRMETDASIQHAPVVVMSARPYDNSVDSVAWLQKPLRVDQLLSTIHQVAGA
jgi:DNA-binding response OmpR family regulator